MDGGKDGTSDMSYSFSAANNKSPTHKVAVAQVREGVARLCLSCCKVLASQGLAFQQRCKLLLSLNG